MSTSYLKLFQKDFEISGEPSTGQKRPRHFPKFSAPLVMENTEAVQGYFCRLMCFPTHMLMDIPVLISTVDISWHLLGQRFQKEMHVYVDHMQTGYSTVDNLCHL